MTPPTLECPKCGANWDIMKEMLAETGTQNKAVAEWMRETCPTCKANFVKVGEIKC